MDDDLRDERGVLYRAIRCPLSGAERAKRYMLNCILNGGANVVSNDKTKNPCHGLCPAKAAMAHANWPPDDKAVPCAKICGKHMYSALP